MDSLKELYKIGNGPSSSHTMGPQRAAERYKNENPQVKSYRVSLFGSLAATGKGHLTDYIIEKTLAPKEVEILWKEEVIKPYHPNAMMFEAIMDDGKAVNPWTVYSVGGGTIAEEGQRSGAIVKKTYPHKTLAEIISYCKKENINLYEYVLRFEDDDILDYMDSIMKAMKKSVDEGLATEELIPGKLNLKRRAGTFFRKYQEDTSDYSMLNYACALATAEQNASGHIIVTAPTCGSAGVLPGIFVSMQKHFDITDQQIIEGLCVAGILGNLIKTNASISGAEVGCQGEVGAACSMGAGAITHILGGTLDQIEYSAEIGLEHHLGMTCDPVFGYVQIPCIERNAMAAKRAYDAAKYSMATDGEHTITFDQVVETMRETGIDMMEKYRETAKGGLAKWFSH